MRIANTHITARVGGGFSNPSSLIPNPESFILNPESPKQPGQRTADRGQRDTDRGRDSGSSAELGLTDLTLRRYFDVPACPTVRGIGWQTGRSEGGASVVIVFSSLGRVFAPDSITGFLRFLKLIESRRRLY
jgi:hypothetical protein